MKELFIEYGYVSLNKYGEELCGDNVEGVTVDGYTTLVLADGLGSGVKANILSTLSSKILCTMVSNNIPIEDCIETMIQTLPVCKVRGVAYSTFSVIHVDSAGHGYLRYIITTVTVSTSTASPWMCWARRSITLSCRCVTGMW